MMRKKSVLLNTIILIFLTIQNIQVTMINNELHKQKKLMKFDGNIKNQIESKIDLSISFFILRY